MGGTFDTHTNCATITITVQYTHVMLVWKVAVCMMRYQVYGHPWVVEQRVHTAGVYCCWEQVVAPEHETFPTAYWICYHSNKREWLHYTYMYKTNNLLPTHLKCPKLLKVCNNMTVGTCTKDTYTYLYEHSACMIRQELASLFRCTCRLHLQSFNYIRIHV